MLRAVVVGFTVTVLAVALVGCGGGPDALTPTPPDSDAQATEVGPLLIRTASAPGLVVEEIPVDFSELSFAALYGSEITWLASQAMLDRIVYVSGSPTDADIFVCNLDGSGRVRLTDNTAAQFFPCWSPDGTRISFDRTWPAEDGEVMIMDANGSGITALTDNTASDTHPTFAPEGRRLAFRTTRTGNAEIFVMYTDGTGPANLTNHGANDFEPDWSSELGYSEIAFTTNRDGNDEIYTMSADGSSPTRVTTNTSSDGQPAWHPDNYDLAYRGRDLGADDIFSIGSGGYDRRDLSAAAGDQVMPAWSSDGRFVCYASNASGDFDLVLQQVEEPWARFALTANTVDDGCPDLGSPTLQTDRVLIGPAGADWGGTDPIWTSAYAGLAVWGPDGYRNFVRIGVRAADLGSLRIEPLMQTAQPLGRPGGVVVAANEVVNLRADAGRGQAPTVWDFEALNPTAVVVYFDTRTGRVLAAAVLRDSVYPAGSNAGAATVCESMQGRELTAQGDFAAVFDAAGNRIAGDAAILIIGAHGEVSAR